MGKGAAEEIEFSEIYDIRYRWKPTKKQALNQLFFCGVWISAEKASPNYLLDLQKKVSNRKRDEGAWQVFRDAYQQSKNIRIPEQMRCQLIEYLQYGN